ncbi:MAG: AMP-binding protein [Actinomycetota bacterium]|nr:AMP-binding protein [Actinomycetota bacterium]
MGYIQAEGITVLGDVPAMVAILEATPGFEEYDLSSLCFLFMRAGPYPEEILREVSERIGADIVVGCGLTEATMGNVTTTLLDDSEEHKLNTIGLPLPGVEVRVVGEDRRELPRERSRRSPCAGRRSSMATSTIPGKLRMYWTRRAGCIPATWPSWTPTATCTWRTGARRCTSGEAKTSIRARLRRSSPGIPG